MLRINYKLISKSASVSSTPKTCAHTDISNFKMYFGFPICSLSRYLTFVRMKTYKGAVAGGRSSRVKGAEEINFFK
jgi:hypothetical protein